MWSIISGFVFSLFCLAFLHQKEAAALGFSQALFGKEVLITKYPWPLVDPILFALPLSTIVFIVVSLFSSKTNERYITKQKHTSKNNLEER